MKNKDFNSLFIKLIVGIILILYILFLYMDFYNVKAFIASKYIKYLSILLCFLLSILSTKDPFVHKANSRDIFLLRLALFITTIADLCLVIFEFYILGIVFFSLVQITYCVRYTNKSIKVTIINFFIVFQCIVLLYLTASLFVGESNILLPISLFYFVCLSTSVVKGIEVWKNNSFPYPNKCMIALGMVLFLLCDICVGLSNITKILPLSGHLITRVQQTSSLLIWVFYLPSQVLLVLSGRAKI